MGDPKSDFLETTTPAKAEDGEQPADPRTGTRYDEMDMDRLGKKQELRRNFRFISIFGFSCTLMSTWEAAIASSLFALTDGGLAGFIWVYLGTIFCMTAVIASMADMASMAPTSGGQYHWVSEFAPPKHQKLLSYTVGWLCTLGWQAGTSLTGLVTGQMIRGLITLNNPDYVSERWHETLLAIGVVLVAAIVNIYFARHLPLLEGLILIFHVLGFFAVIVPLWVLAPRNSAEKTFTEFYDGGGWGSIGTACIVGMITSITTFMGADSAVHMSEEVRDASRIVARSMIATTVLNGALGLLTVITLCFCITDLETVLMSPTGFPYIEVFYMATSSKGGATAMTSVIIVLTQCACISFLATASRQTFAFARDDGLFLPSVFSKVVTKGGTEIPFNAVLVSLTLPVIIALLNLGSSAAFLAVTSLLVAALFASYFISIACILRKRLLGEPLPPTRWSMGRLAIPVNIFALCYIVFAFVMSCFPLYKEVTPVTMNWASVVFCGVLGFALVVYFIHGRKIYKGPVVWVKSL